MATRSDRFVDEALLSADSVRQRFPSLPITLFTDRPEYAAKMAGTFDRVLPVAGVSGLCGTWSEGIFDRLCCLQRSPYEMTLYLDTDTVVVTTELPRLFDLRCDVAMAETTLDDSYSRYHYGRPILNSGVILYRRNGKTRDWLDRWISISERNFRLAREMPLPPVDLLRHVPDVGVRRRLLANDQISLAELLTPEVNRTDLAFECLDYSWNHRGSRFPERNREPIRIRHWPRSPAPQHIAHLASSVAAILAQRGGELSAAVGGTQEGQRD